MSYFLRVLLVGAITCSCAGGTERRDQRPTHAQTSRVDSPTEGKSDHKGEEILGPRLGQFIFIPGGEFTMGCNNGEDADERPEHVVELSSFYIGRTPVTNAQFVRFLNEAKVKPEEYLFPQAGYCKPSVTRVAEEWRCTPGTENDAACCETWMLAERYCRWLSAKTGRKCRLPTEAQWEYTCRGKEGRKFPWGDSRSGWARRVWCWQTWNPDKPNTVPVGSFPDGATPEGVCDLVGYMDEVCSDWYDPGYYAKLPKKNPQGPSEPVKAGRYRNAKMRRGGLEHHYKGFFHTSEFFGVLPAAYLPRGWSRACLTDAMTPPKKPSHVYGRLGFRVVVETGNEKASRRIMPTRGGTKSNKEQQNNDEAVAK